MDEQQKDKPQCEADEGLGWDDCMKQLVPIHVDVATAFQMAATRDFAGDRQLMRSIHMRYL